MLLSQPAPVFAHAGHGDEFHGASEATRAPGSVQVDAETAKRLGMKVEPVKLERLDIGIKTSGQIETLPSKQVEVTAPLAGKVVELLVEPGATVKAGQTVAVLSSPELAALRVESEEKRAQALADVKEAEANLKLAKENYQRQVKISQAEIAQAETQLAAARKQYERDRELVEGAAVVAVAKENYQRQVEIAAAEIARAETELAVASEQYERDKELAETGAIARRQMLESQAHFAEAQAAIARAKSRPNVVEAETEVKRAEVELPVRELRESQGKVAEAEAQLTKAKQSREVLEAEAEIKRATAALEVANSRLELSSATYKTRLQQVEALANEKGLVTVKAPISGTVSDREITLGQSVQEAGSKLMTILNNSEVFATANIYEKDIDKIAIGQRVSVKVTSLPDRAFTGRIAVIGSAVEGDTRVVPVKAEIENYEGQIKPGMFADIEIFTEQTNAAILAIPSSAVVEANGKQIVYVQNGSAFQPVEVELGQTSGDLVEIRNGLFEGDLIVTQRAFQLYAQSLRGDSKHEENHEKPAVSQAVEAKFSSIPLSMWLMGAGVGGAIATATFAAGAFWASRRAFRLPSNSDNLSASEDYPVLVPASEVEAVATNEARSWSDNHHVSHESNTPPGVKTPAS